MPNAQSSKSASGTKAKGGTQAKKTEAAASDTGVRDENYALISVLYHALQAADTCAQYVRDAEKAGDEQLVEYLEKVRSSQAELAQEGKDLLATRLDGDDDATDDEADEDEED